jgi:hypothetical protein
MIGPTGTPVDEADAEDEVALDALLSTAEPRTGREAAAEAARLFLEQLGLPFPPMPQAWLDDLLELGPGHFATRTGLPGLAEPGAWLARLRDRTLPDHVAFGLGGHGLAGRVVVYALARGPLALLLQVPWGGAYDDPQVQAGEARRVLDLAAGLVAAPGLDRLPPGRRLVVIQGNDDPEAGAGGRLGWLDERGRGELPPHPAALVEALAMVEGLTPR